MIIMRSGRLRSWCVRHRDFLVALLLIPLLALQWWLAPDDVGAAVIEPPSAYATGSCNVQMQGTPVTSNSSAQNVNWSYELSCTGLDSNETSSATVWGIVWRTGETTYPDYYVNFNSYAGSSPCGSLAATPSSFAMSSYVAGNNGTHTALSLGGSSQCLTASNTFNSSGLGTSGTFNLGGISAAPIEPLQAWVVYWGSGSPTYDPDVSVTFTSGVFSSGNLGCQLTEVTGDTSMIGQTYTSAMSAANQTFSFTFGFTGSVDSIVLVDDSVSSGTQELLWGKEFYTSGASFDFGDGPGSISAPDTFSYSPAVGDVINPDVWCHTGGSGSGAAWIDWGKLSALGSSPVNNTPYGTSPSTGTATQTGGAFDITACFASAGWDLYNPVTWVLGALHDSVCVVEWLFEPSSSSVSSIQETFGLGGSATCSGALGIAAWTGCLSKAVIATPSADVASFKSAVDGGSCSNSLLGTSGVWHLQAVNRISAPSASFGMCSVLVDATPGAADSSTGTNSAESLVQELLTAAVYIFAILWLVQFLRRTIRSGA